MSEPNQQFDCHIPGHTINPTAPQPELQDAPVPELRPAPGATPKRMIFEVQPEEYMAGLAAGILDRVTKQHATYKAVLAGGITIYAAPCISWCICEDARLDAQLGTLAMMYIDGDYTSEHEQEVVECIKRVVADCAILALKKKVGEYDRVH